MRTCLESYPVAPGSIVFYDAKVLFGREGINQTQTPPRLVGYTVGGKTYWFATSRFDLTAEQIALIYKLRWDIRNVLCLVEEAPQGLSSHFKKPPWSDDPDACRPDRLSPARDLLS